MVNPFCSKITQDNQAGITTSSDSELWKHYRYQLSGALFSFSWICLGLIQILVLLLPAHSKQVGRPGKGRWVNPGGVTIREILLTWQSGDCLRGIGTHSKRKQKNLFHFWRALYTFCYFQILAFVLRYLVLTMFLPYFPLWRYGTLLPGRIPFQMQPCFQQLGLPWCTDEADICYVEALC